MQKKNALRPKQGWPFISPRKLRKNVIDIYRTSISRSQPLSDEWCESYNALQKELITYEQIHKKGGVAGDETFR